MSDDDQDGDDDRKRCPRCGEPVAFATVRGPSEATLSPCGCIVPADALED